MLHESTGDIKLGPFRKVLEMGQICKVYIKTSRTKLHHIFIKNGLYYILKQ